ncbi:MAG TPA: hypothetical protein V6D23_10565 [Candidatus Obscuribacterales bacterium]
MNSYLRILSVVSVLATISACTATANIQGNLPNTNRPSGTPSVVPSARPTVQPNSRPSDVPSSNPSAEASGSGSLVITGQDLFNKYTVSYHAGQKWVYKMTQPNTGTSVAVPSLPPGVTLPPGFNIPGSSSSSSITDLGELVWEVISVDDAQVTMKTTTTVNTPVGSQTTTKTTTSARTNFASQISQSMATGTEGTIVYTFGAGNESVSVPAGSYTADRIDGVFKIKTNVNGVSGTSDTNVKLWVTNEVGLVKYEAQSTTATSGVTVNTTTLFELKSFTG